MSKPVGEGISNRTLTIRLNEVQLEALKQRAREKQMSQSVYLMHLVEKDLNTEKELVND